MSATLQVPGALIYERMAAILDELPAIGKDDYNPQQSFSYRGIEAILKELNPLLGKHQVFYVPRVLERVPEQRQTHGGKALWTVHLHVEYRFFTTDGSHVVADAWGEGTDMADKATSKAMTMAEKSLLVQAFCIAAQGDTDGDAGAEEGEPVDPEKWFKDAGWTTKEQHDQWRALTGGILKESDAPLRAAFGKFREAHKIAAFADGLSYTMAQAQLIDRFLDGEDVDVPAAAAPGEEAPAQTAAKPKSGVTKAVRGSAADPNPTPGHTGVGSEPPPAADPPEQATLQ